MADLRQWFGGLREMLQERSPSPDVLLPLLKRAHALNPDQYESEWIPYLGSFEIPPLEVSTLDEMLGFSALWPDTQLFALNNFAEHLGASTIMALCKRPALSRVCQWDLGYNGVHVEGAFALAHSPYTRSLKTLRLDYGAIEVDGMQALSQSRGLVNLSTLSLRQCHIWNDGFDALAHGELGQLRHLDLSHNGISALRLDDRTHQLGALTSLNLEENQLDDDAVAVLMRQCVALTEINLEYNRLTAQGLSALTSHQRLRTLNLSYNGIGNAGLGVLRYANWPELRSLNLSCCEIDDDGVQLLLASDWLKKLDTLTLEGNEISDESMVALGIECPQVSVFYGES